MHLFSPKRLFTSLILLFSFHSSLSSASTCDNIFKSVENDKLISAETLPFEVEIRGQKIKLLATTESVIESRIDIPEKSLNQSFVTKNKQGQETTQVSDIKFRSMDELATELTQSLLPLNFALTTKSVWLRAMEAAKEMIEASEGAKSREQINKLVETDAVDIVKVKNEFSHYFDTPKQQLQKSGISVRHKILYNTDAKNSNLIDSQYLLLSMSDGTDGSFHKRTTLKVELPSDFETNMVPPLVKEIVTQFKLKVFKPSLAKKMLPVSSVVNERFELDVFSMSLGENKIGTLSFDTFSVDNLISKKSSFNKHHQLEFKISEAFYNTHTEQAVEFTKQLNLAINGSRISHSAKMALTSENKPKKKVELKPFYEEFYFQIVEAGAFRKPILQLGIKAKDKNNDTVFVSSRETPAYFLEVAPSSLPNMQLSNFRINDGFLEYRKQTKEGWIRFAEEVRGEEILIESSFAIDGPKSSAKKYKLLNNSAVGIITDPNTQALKMTLNL